MRTTVRTMRTTRITLRTVGEIMRTTVEMMRMTVEVMPVTIGVMAVTIANTNETMLPIKPKRRAMLSFFLWCNIPFGLFLGANHFLGINGFSIGNKRIHVNSCTQV